MLCFLFFQCFTSFADKQTYNLPLHNTLTQETWEKPNVLPRHPTSPRLWLQLKKTMTQELSERLRCYSSARRSRQNSTKRPVTATHTLHQSILVQDFTLAQKCYGSNILALEHSKMRKAELVMKGWIWCPKPQVQPWASKVHFALHVQYFLFSSCNRGSQRLLSSPDLTDDWRHLIHHTYVKHQAQTNPRLRWSFPRPQWNKQFKRQSRVYWEPPVMVTWVLHNYAGR